MRGQQWLEADKVVRANHRAVMVFNDFLGGAPKTYCIYDLDTQKVRYCGTLNACKKAWNRHYATSRQFVAVGNHRYL